MGLLDRFGSGKASRKRSNKQIRYDRILNRQQEQILESQQAVIMCLKEECKSLRQILISQDDLYQEFGIEPMTVTNDNSLPTRNGQFNTSDLLASVAKGIKPESIPFGKPALDAFVSFLQSNSQEVNALGSHYMKQMIPKKDIDNQVVTQ